MENKVIFKSLLDCYNRHSFTHLYIFGYRENGVIYYALADSRILPYVLKLDKASRNAGFSLRFKPSKEQIAVLKTNAVTVRPLCSEQYFDSVASKSPYNKGEIFEKLFTESRGQTWTKDNVPFTEAGDIVLGGKHLQIKFQGGTFLSEAQALRLG